MKCETEMQQQYLKRFFTQKEYFLSTAQKIGGLLNAASYVFIAGGDFSRISLEQRAKELYERLVSEGLDLERSLHEVCRECEIKFNTQETMKYLNMAVSEVGFQINERCKDDLNEILMYCQGTHPQQLAEPQKKKGMFKW